MTVRTGKEFRHPISPAQRRAKLLRLSQRSRMSQVATGKTVIGLSRLKRSPRTPCAKSMPVGG